MIPFTTTGPHALALFLRAIVGTAYAFRELWHGEGLSLDDCVDSMLYEGTPGADWAWFGDTAWRELADPYIAARGDIWGRDGHEAYEPRRADREPAEGALWLAERLNRGETVAFDMGGEPSGDSDDWEPRDLWWRYSPADEAAQDAWARAFRELWECELCGEPMGEDRHLYWRDARGERYSGCITAHKGCGDPLPLAYYRPEYGAGAILCERAGTHIPARYADAAPIMERPRAWRDFASCARCGSVWHPNGGRDAAGVYGAGDGAWTEGPNLPDLRAWREG